MPSDAQLMQIAIDDLKNSSLLLEEHLRALQELLILVEPIDNANGGYTLSFLCGDNLDGPKFLIRWNSFCSIMDYCVHLDGF